VRLFFSAFLAVVFALAPLRAQDTEPPLPAYLKDVPEPLARAVHKLARDVDRWAYTMRSVNFDSKGTVDGEVVARFNPSLHYDEQWTLVSRNGKPATEAEVRKFRKERAKRAKNRQALGELLELAKATVVEETSARIRYEVPLRKENNDRLPPDKFRILIAVSKPQHGLEQIDVALRSPMRVAVIARVKQAGAELRFATVDPAHAPALVSIDAKGSFTLMMVPLSDSYKLERSDFKRVKPYDERFDVTIGPMKVIDF
jgi:hypothetical protein